MKNLQTLSRYFWKLSKAIT